MKPNAIHPVRVTRVRTDTTERDNDELCTEEPLQIDAASESDTPVAVTMRTPGNDLDLALGFAISEGLAELAGGENPILQCLDLPAQQSRSPLEKVENPLAEQAGLIDGLPSCAELIDSIVAEAVEQLQEASGFIF